MARYIDADKIEKTLWASLRGYRHTEEICAIKNCILEIKEAPTADVVEVKHGKWLVNEMELIESPVLYNGVIVRRVPLSYRCSECGRVEEYQEPYCNCGAKMELKGGAVESYV